MSASKIIESALTEGRIKLLEHEAFELAKEYGIPVPNAILVKTPEEAAKYADDIGYPIALKVVSPDITHKSDVGGVRLNLRNSEEVARGVAEIFRNVSNKAPGAKIVGVLMYKMAPQGLEVIVGGVRDNVFGPVVMFGLGGIFVEVLKDVSFRIAPVSLEEALAMMGEIKSAKILEGYRGQPPVNKEALADIVVKLGKMMLDLPVIESVDLNPVMAYPSGAIAVDVRVILKRG